MGSSSLLNTRYKPINGEQDALLISTSLIKIRHNDENHDENKIQATLTHEKRNIDDESEIFKKGTKI